MAEAAIKLDEYTVTEDCIACDACCNDFPDIFKMNAEHTLAIAVNKSPEDKYNPWDIVTVCPVDAIKLVSRPMPEMPESLKPKKKEAAPPVDDRNWEERWNAVKGRLEPQWERMKRYGMASSVEDEESFYRIRFDMPERIPDHQLKYQWGLPDRMPDYKYSVEIDGPRVKIRAKLEDENVKRLCGRVNSFPEGFLREMVFERPIKGHRENYDEENRILEVTLDKA